MRFREQLGAALAEAKRLAAGALHLPRQENPHADQRDKRQPGDQERNEPGHVVGLRPRRNRDALVVEALHQRRIVRRIGLEAAAAGEVSVNLRTLNDDVLNASIIDVVEQLRKADFLRARIAAGVLKQRKQRQKQEDDNHPQGEIAQISVHLRSLIRNRMRCPAPPFLPCERGGFTSLYCCNVGAGSPPAKGIPCLGRRPYTRIQRTIGLLCKAALAV